MMINTITNKEEGNMKTTKAAYITNHPKSRLASRLLSTDWPDNQTIIIGSGLIAPTTKCSNLYRDLRYGHSDEYIVGGRAGKNATEGYWYAVRDTTP
jgi:hypothetical protein